MPRSIWNGVISFGMVSIPVKLYSATENRDIAFHQLHDKCETRIKYQKWCPHCEEVVDQDHIERGYEFARGQYVVLDDEDFEQIPLPSKHTIAVSAFVNSEQIDPIYYEKSYYLEPDEAALRPFTLFMKALQDMEMVAIAAITLRNKERLCALRTLGGTLIIDTLLYPDEVRVDEDTEAPNVKVSEKELAMAEHLIELMKQDFDPSQYHDHYREALKKVIEAKLEGKEIEVPEERAQPKVVDLMDALRASVENIKANKGRSLADDDKEVTRLIKHSSRKTRGDEEEEGEEKTPKRRASLEHSKSSSKAEKEEEEAPTRRRRRSSRSSAEDKEKSTEEKKPASETTHRKRRRKESA